MSEPWGDAVEVLRRGGVIACPTETLVGLLAHALDAQAVARVVAIKRRGDDPIGVLLPSLDELSQVAPAPSDAALRLAEAHWPGPLTLVMHARPGLPAALLRDGKIGVRVPGPSPALELARRFGGPLTATSANRTGEPAARTTDEARAVLGHDVDLYIAGDAPGGAPSTVVDVTETPMRVLRRGAVDVSVA